jgi:hypothetical protein
MFISIQNSIFRAAKLRRIFYKSIEYTAFFPNVPKNYTESEQNGKEGTKVNNEELSSILKRILQKLHFVRNIPHRSGIDNFSTLLFHYKKKKNRFEFRIKKL